MRVTKPIKQSILHRTYQYRGENHFAASIFTMFSLSEPGRILPENELWQTVAQALGRDGMLDAAMPKSRAEYIVMGSFHAPGGKPVPAGEVSVKLGKLEKRLNVFGDRYWKKAVGIGLGVTDPEPMSELPLTFSNAFGGKDYKENPLGKGATAVETDDGKRQPLPNIELPERLIGSPDDKPPPASFGMIDLTWPQRFRKVGTYDQKWQKERAPGLADDIDWTHFNTTAPDQWLDGFFKGDESFVLQNLHPEKSRIEGYLPGLISRVFISRKSPDGSELFRELVMKLDTVYFLPTQDVGLILWRGDDIIGTDDGMDIEQIMVAYERLRDPRRSLEHYEAALHKRLDPKSRAKYLLNEADLIPEGDRSGLIEIIERGEEETGREALLTRNLKVHAIKEREQVREKMLAAGVKPEQFPAAEKIEDTARFKLDDFDLDVMVDEAKQRAEQARQEAMTKVRAMCEQFGQDFDQLMQKTRARVVLPRFTGAVQLENMRKLMASFPAAAEKFNAALAAVPGEDLNVRMKQAEDAFHSGYARAAHQMISTLPEERRAGLDALRTEVLARYKRGESLAQMDLAGITLAGEDLSGADFSGAYLEFANLSGANLSGTNLSGAILAKADMNEVVLDGANLSGACLGKANLYGARGDGLKLERAVLSEAILTGSIFVRASLSDSQILNGDFSNCAFKDSRIDNVLFYECNLKETNFEGSEFSKALFVQGQGMRINLSRTHGTGLLCVNIGLEGAIFRDARLPNLRVVGESTLKGADFTRANLQGSNLRALDMEEAHFEQAILDGCEMSDSNLSGAKLTGVSAVHALFMRTNFEAADLSRINGMETMLNKARLVNANLEHSNFYGAEFLGVTVGDTRFGGANLKLTKLKDWHP
ncbi:MAG TPA: DUF2169 domain-containing protein [Gammaproteobacteria bacterium]|jgi:uncharacterized protein YjbI with pentapeptide repeats|nr:DUF2169 domain-containing protein [Gammaproteobacteria bacterium]